MMKSSNELEAATSEIEGCLTRQMGNGDAVTRDNDCFMSVYAPQVL